MSSHRPMFPEYVPKSTMERTLTFLEKDNLYDSSGTKLATSDGILPFIRDGPYSVFISSLCTEEFLPYLYELADDEKSKVLCSRRGKPFLARMQAKKNSSRWIVSCRSWGEQECSPEFLQNMERLYEYYGLGFKPTPSSLGVELMRQVWKEYNLPRHTAPNLACEQFIRDNAVGGIVQTPGKGRYYNELMYLDMASAWVSMYVLHPTGTPIAFRGNNIECFSEFFCRCDIFVPSTLPLGCFPIRKASKTGQRVVYPTEEGVYRDVYLWGIQIEDCRRAGCIVNILNGYGWNSLTKDNFHWSEHAYRFRNGSNDGFITKQSKAINVAAIGRMFRPREQYSLTGNGDIALGDKPVFTEGREPLDLYLHKEYDSASALMVHWYAYTIASCNSHVYNFALPYAKEGRLVSIDYDSIMILENGERGRFIQKKSMEALECPPGTWLYMMLHNVHVLNHRAFKSDELTKMPGITDKDKDKNEVQFRVGVNKEIK